MFESQALAPDTFRPELRQMRDLFNGSSFGGR
jgi:hypothetical protein